MYLWGVAIIAVLFAFLLLFDFRNGEDQDGTEEPPAVTKIEEEGGEFGHGIGRTTIVSTQAKE